MVPQDGQSETHPVIPDGLGNPGGLAVGQRRCPVDGICIGRSDTHAHPGPGHDDPPALTGKLSVVTLEAHRPNPTATMAHPEHHRPFRSPPRSSIRPPIWDETTKPRKKKRRKIPALLAESFSEIWAYSLAKKKMGMKVIIEISRTMFSLEKARIRKILTWTRGMAVLRSTARKRQ